MTEQGDFNAYIVVGGPENFATTRELGFTMHGLKSTRRKMAAGIKPGDRLIFYLTGVKRFAGSVVVTSEMFEDRTPIWSNPKKPAESYPYRVRIEPELVLSVDEAVPAEPLAAHMTYTQKWPAANWTLAFQGNLHLVPREDYDLILSALREAAAVRVKGVRCGIYSRGYSGHRHGMPARDVSIQALLRCAAIAHLSGHCPSHRDRESARQRD